MSILAFRRRMVVLCLTLTGIVVCGSTAFALESLPREAKTQNLAIQGSKLSAEKAARIESQLRSQPDNLTSRTLILGYLFLQSAQSAELRRQRVNHVLWVIEHQPGSELAGLPYATLDPILDGEGYQKGRDLWLKNTDRMSTNTAMLGNAANYFFINERETAERLLKKAKALEPGNPEWSERLGQLYGLQGRSEAASAARHESARKQYQELKEAYDKETMPIKKQYMLEDLAKAALATGDDAGAGQYAREALQTAQDKKDWNYGNAIQHGNLILGQLALKRGDVAQARKYLLAAGRTPGSPQLNSFGPNMTLARELLEKGERDVVLEYFDLCGKFWKHEQLAHWRQEVQAGRIPEFGPNLAY